MHEHGSATGSRTATSHDAASAVGPARVCGPVASRSVPALSGSASADGRPGTGPGPGPGVLGRPGFRAAAEGIYGICSNP
ncbi:hypothetical protein ACWFRJ_16680 [Streptomyces sp. NPDC055239]